MNELQKAAEILVECGYAEKNTSGVTHGQIFYEVLRNFLHITVEPFVDTLEGRRQADAIEDWLLSRQHQLMSNSNFTVACNNIETKEYKTGHQWRLDRIKWCLQELSK